MLALTLPQAVAQSTQALCDLYAAVPMLAFGLYVLKIARCDGWRMWRWSVAAGVALGMAGLTKWSSLIYGAIFGIILGCDSLLQRWRNRGSRSALAMGAAMGLAAVLGAMSIMPQIGRNWREYGDLFSGEPKHAMTVEGLTPKLFAVNVVKHIATHLSLPSKVLNAPIERVTRRICGEDINNSRIHYGESVISVPFKLVSTCWKSAPFVTNPLHALLFAVVLWVWFSKWRQNETVLWRAGVPVVMGALVYCAVFKWQLWNVRLTLPLYGWMAAGVGFWLGARETQSVRMILCALAVCAVAQAGVRPMWFMPSFLFGKGTVESRITYDMTISDKVRRLAALGWPMREIETMRETAPEVERYGYSIFYTKRLRQRVFGAEIFRRGSWVYSRYETALRSASRLRNGDNVAKSLGLLISSDNGNLPPEVWREPLADEYLLWTWGGGEAGRNDWRWEHFGLSDPAERAREIFGTMSGVILSDKTRESVVERLMKTREVTLVASNELFNVYVVKGM